MFAAQYGQPECVRLLLEGGADTETKNSVRDMQVYAVSFFCGAPGICLLLATSIEKLRETIFTRCAFRIYRA